MVLSFAALGVSCSASTEQAAFTGIRDLHCCWWWRGQKNDDVQPAKTVGFLWYGIKKHTWNKFQWGKCTVCFPQAVAVRCVIQWFFSSFSQFLLHSDDLSVSCCPWCPADWLWPCPWCAHGKLWAAQAAALGDRPGSLDILPQSNFTQIPSLLNFVLHFWFLGDFLKGCVCV